ncbi:hypothetical protein JCGZ_08528 [Jatropha curcas]|uniref:Thioesterase domain-containing protein n=1 Tax=Jatropha curcas TaxID=180498 RepID=A0A067LDJ1_JATCU|nr:hypothetical protein JCGZ_08528 [Jatropha curcas]
MQARENASMEKTKEFFKLSEEESGSVSQLTIHPHRFGLDCSFYEDFALRGMRVDRVEPGFISCTFKDRSGKLTAGAVADLVDVVGVGGTIVYVEGLLMTLPVDMSISFLSTANVNVGTFGIRTDNHLHYKADIHDEDVKTLLGLIVII